MSLIKKGNPMVIAGPCSAETEEQVLETAKMLAELNIDLFRAGIWKPRTRPGSFEGVGEEGLAWLRTVKDETGLPVTTEIATAKHAYEALKHGVDVLWLGARTTANPFAVQEIADALKGVKVPVMVKNPVNPDVALWAGAIERIRKAGVEDVSAIHRGVSQYEKTKYRNNPEWRMAIALRKEFQDIQLICDPSHIAGDRALIAQVSQKAMDLDFDGLMIETHPTPDEAWSDAKQQVTPASLKSILDDLVVRQEKIQSTEQDLDAFRNKINRIDEELLDLFQERMSVSKNIGNYKKDNNLTVFQKGRWIELLEELKSKGYERELSEDFVGKIYELIHQESVNIQSDIMKK